MINDVRAIAISFPHTGLAASPESEAWRVCIGVIGGAHSEVLYPNQIIWRLIWNITIKDT